MKLKYLKMSDDKVIHLIDYRLIILSFTEWRGSMMMLLPSSSGIDICSIDQGEGCPPVFQCLDVVGEDPLLLLHLLVFAE